VDALARVRGSYRRGIEAPCIVISMLPCIGIYVFLQKYYVSGLLSGAVK
jgi:ABC-type glycerol-3-phosphate transport system permease component